MTLRTETRVWRRTAIIAGAGVVLGVVGAIILAITDGAGDGVSELGGGLTLGGFAGMFSVFPAQLAASELAQAPLRDLTRERRRAVRGAVRSRDQIELTFEERRRSVYFAEALPVVQTYSLGMVTLLYIGLVGSQLFGVAGWQQDQVGYHLGLFVVLILAIAILVPFSISRMRRARGYAERE